MHKTLELLFGRVYELIVVNQPHRTRNMTKPVTRHDPLIVLFATNDKAEAALRSAGFALIGGIWKSKDGLIDAYVKVRSDGQYRIELHA